MLVYNDRFGRFHQVRTGWDLIRCASSMDRIMQGIDRRARLNAKRSRFRVSGKRKRYGSVIGTGRYKRYRYRYGKSRKGRSRRCYSRRGRY